MPDWPVNDKAAKATVEWDSHGLHIVADNSSLKQILEDVATATGARLVGVSEDEKERVFGTYGPGAARDVLSQLLDGTGYNVLMSGDQGQGTPREIVLSRRQAGTGQQSSNGSQNTASAASQNSADEDATPEEPQPVEEPQPQPSSQPAQQPQFPNRSGVGGGLRGPQQILQEMQERQQQLQQQQQQQNNSQ
jgi:hypothetical protein